MTTNHHTRHNAYPTIRLFLLWIALVVLPLTSFATFDFNSNCQKAYEQLFLLKLNAARQFIAAERKVNPENDFLPLLDNYVDYLYLFTTENKNEFDRLKANKSARLDRLDDADKRSPYYRYAQAEINLQWAIIRGRYGEYFSAGLEIKRAYSLLTENAQKFPGFHLNLKSLGMVNCVLGSLQDGALKTALSVIGIKGNAQEGLAMLDKLAENLPKSAYEPFYEEVVFCYAFMLTDVVNSPLAYAKISRLVGRFKEESLLRSYLIGYVGARTGHNDEAIAALSDRPSGAAYQPFPYLDYLLGLCRLNKLDYNGAERALDTFLRTNKGNNYIRDANLHVGWILLIQGNNNGFNAAMQKVRSTGYNYNERDRQAINEANAPVPDITLLKSKLLFDGGYYEKSLAYLESKRPDEFTSDKDKAEYYYRLGRVNTEQEKYDSAIANYQQSINYGKKLKYYFAANSALQIGKIFELKKNFPKARAFFNLAIGMKGHEYENSIESQAKSGLKRTAG